MDQRRERILGYWFAALISCSSPNRQFAPSEDAGAPPAGDTTGGGGESGASPEAERDCAEVCEGDRRICDPRVGRCVECTSDAHCGGDRPACAARSNTCVPCTELAHCTNPERPLCHPETNTCVRCVDDSQCPNPGASRCDDGQCVRCVQHADCGHIRGRRVCAEGACVQCTGREYSCGTRGDTGEAYVCNAVAHTCSSEFVERSADLCEPCISDAHCKPGQVCAAQRFGSAGTLAGNFCFLREREAPDGQCGLATRPYPAAIEVITLEGEVVTVCAPATTTCVALNAAGTPCTSPEGEPDDSLCGATPPTDGSCHSGADDSQCTSACRAREDCPSGKDCVAGAQICN